MKLINKIKSYLKVKTKMIQPLSFFTERIGKRIYRNPYPCCVHCDDVADNGLIVHDMSHADYLYMMQNAYANEDVFLDYKDEKPII